MTTLMCGSYYHCVGGHDYSNVWQLFQLQLLFYLQEGMTVVMHAAYNGHIEACRKLVAMGADVNRVQKDGVSV